MVRRACARRRKTRVSGMPATPGGTGRGRTQLCNTAIRLRNAQAGHNIL
jgi:hypothetical protein